MGIPVRLESDVLDSAGLQFVTQSQQDLFYRRLAVFYRQNLDQNHPGPVFIGNSLTQGFNFESFFPGMVIHNRGIISDRIGIGCDGGVLKRLEASCFDVPATAVFIMIGINDIADRRRSVPEISQGYYGMVETIRAGIPSDHSIYLQALLPVSGRYTGLNPAIDSLNRDIRNWAEARSGMDRIFYLNRSEAWCDDSGRLRPELTGDGIHLTQAGYRLWSRQLLPYLAFPSGRCDLKAILSEQIRRYPHMEADDWMKLIYHASMGNRHLMEDSSAAHRYLEREMAGINDSNLRLVEIISPDNQLARIDLRAYKFWGLSVDRLFDVMIRSARQTEEDSVRLDQYAGELIRWLNQNGQSRSAGQIPERLNEIRVHHGQPSHSEPYKQAYHPHYRVVRTDIFRELVFPEFSLKR